MRHGIVIYPLGMFYTDVLAKEGDYLSLPGGSGKVVRYLNQNIEEVADVPEGVGVIKLYRTEGKVNFYNVIRALLKENFRPKDREYVLNYQGDEEVIVMFSDDEVYKIYGTNPCQFQKIVSPDEETFQKAVYVVIEP